LRDIARRRSSARFGALALTAAALVAAAASQSSPAVAATKAAPPTITSAFTPSLIGVGQTTSVGYTITNPNALATLSNVAVNITLGGGAVVDNPNGLNTSGCGTALLVTANPGDTSIVIGSVIVKAGTPCVISLAITSPTAGTSTSTASPLNSSAGNSAAGSSATLTVLADPTVTATAPTEGAKYAYGQQVTVNYSCAQAADTTGITGCTAQDDLGNNIATGGLLDTTVPGAHELTISAFSVTGAETDDAIDYTVLPDNVFTLKGVKTSGGKVAFKLALPGPGKVKIKAFAGSKTFSKTTLKINGQKTVSVKLVPTSAGAKLLTAGTVKLKLQVTYTPTGGVAKTVTKHGIKLS
jgi:hypothetical protein